MGCASSKGEAGVLQTAPADGLASEANVEARSTSPRRQNAAGLTAKTLKSAGRSGPAAVLKLVPARVPGDLPAWAAGLALLLIRFASVEQCSCTVNGFPANLT